jgi:hypothetical protein
VAAAVHQQSVVMVELMAAMVALVQQVLLQEALLPILAVEVEEEDSEVPEVGAAEAVGLEVQAQMVLLVLLILVQVVVEQVAQQVVLVVAE